MSNIVDERLRVSLGNAKIAKAQRVRKWKELRTPPPHVVFELTGYPTKGHRQSWFEREAAILVGKVFAGLSAGGAPYDRSFVCNRFILDTVGCWSESGFDVTIKEIPSLPGQRIVKSEVYVTVRVTLQDSTKPFAAFKKAEMDQDHLVSRRQTEERVVLTGAIERIQRAILLESQSLAFAGICAIEMPALYQLRDVPKSYGSAQLDTERRTIRLANFTKIEGLPLETITATQEHYDGRARFLPLDHEFMSNNATIAALWKFI